MTRGPLPRTSLVPFWEPVRAATDTQAYGHGVQFNDWEDGSVLEAASWRLASELARRHPHTLRLIRAHPGGGLSDCLWFLSAVGDHDGDVRLNRNGTIQVLERFDGRPSAWEPVSWDEYLRSDPREFLDRLEIEAGLPRPSAVPKSTPRTLTLRILAAIAATAVKSVEPIEISPGIIDTSGPLGGGVDRGAFEAFPAIPSEMLEPRGDDLKGHAEYRFWFVRRNDVPVLAFEQSHGLAWTAHHDNAWVLMDLYTESRRHLLVTALKLLRRVDHV